MFRPRHPFPRPAEHAGPSPSSFANLQTFQHSNFLTLPPAIPFRITSFADPYPLTPVESHLCKKRREGPHLPGRLFFNQIPITRPRTEHAGTPASPILSCNSAHFPSHMGVYTPRPLIFAFPFSNFALSLPLLTIHYSLFTSTYRATVLRKG
jgi:hypothetical protein